MINDFPYSNLHALNLDWILEELGTLDERFSSFLDPIVIQLSAGTSAGGTWESDTSYADIKTNLNSGFRPLIIKHGSGFKTAVTASDLGSDPDYVVLKLWGSPYEDQFRNFYLAPDGTYTYFD